MAADSGFCRVTVKMNPVSDRQPIERGMRYANMRSAMAEEGVLRLLCTDDSVFGDAPPLREEEFSSPLLGRLFARLWQPALRDPEW